MSEEASSIKYSSAFGHWDKRFLTYVTANISLAVLDRPVLSTFKKELQYIFIHYDNFPCKIQEHFVDISRHMICRSITASNQNRCCFSTGSISLCLSMNGFLLSVCIQQVYQFTLLFFPVSPRFLFKILSQRSSRIFPHNIVPKQCVCNKNILKGLSLTYCIWLLWVLVVSYIFLCSPFFGLSQWYNHLLSAQDTRPCFWQRLW